MILFYWVLFITLPTWKSGKKKGWNRAAASSFVGSLCGYENVFKYRTGDRYRKPAPAGVEQVKQVHITKEINLQKCTNPTCNFNNPGYLQKNTKL